MRQSILWLAVASLCTGSAQAFSVHDDIFAFPQYEIVFSDKYISENDAKEKLIIGATSEPSSTASADAAEPSQTPKNGGSDLSTPESSDKPDLRGDKEDEAVSQAYERMVLQNRTYLCSIPQPRQPKNETKEELSAEAQEQELARATDRGWELLEGMKGNCMYYQSGWWSYSFCYKSEIKQFHPMSPGRGSTPSYPPVEDTRVPAFHLGVFGHDQPATQQVDSKSKSKAVQSEGSALAIRKKGESRYMVQYLNGGSTCDLTGRPRKIEVQFHCHPQSTDRIGWIKETATCSYLMVIYTPRLCNDVAFLPPKEHKAASIVCSEIVGAAQLDDWNSRAAARMERLLLGNTAPSAPARPVVGGIEVGGMKLAGPDGQKVPPPQTVEQVPNQGELVARWAPNRADGEIEMLSDADLKSLGLDPDTVHDLKDKIHDEANGRPWKIELIQLQNGNRDLVAILDQTEEAKRRDQQARGAGSKETLKDPEKEKGKGNGKEKEKKKPKDEPQGNDQDKDEKKKPSEEKKGKREKGSKEVFKDEL